MVRPRVIELRWPSIGVQRSQVHERVASAVSYPTPWAVNCRLSDPFKRRLRGGSRPGLTKFVADDMGTTIADLASVTVSGTTGVRELLVVLVDSTVKVVEDGVTTTPVANITDVSGNNLTDASGNEIVASSSTASADGFLVVGQQKVVSVSSGSITRIDPKTGQVDALTASKGTVPTSVTFGVLYRDRLCLSGEDNAIYMSRQEDYTDWDYGEIAEDESRAVPFQLSFGGEVGPKPTALISHEDQYLLAASRRTLWVVSGDPTTGSLRRVSENTGIVGPRAWCKIEDRICFLSETGLHLVSASGADLSSITDDAIPDEIRDIDVSTTTVSLGYEHDRRAVHVYLRTSAGSDDHWVYELDGGAWWTQRLSDDHSPLTTCQHQGKLLLAGADGYIRYVGGDDDDGTAIESHVLLGPIRLAGVNINGLIQTIHGVFGQGSGDVEWAIVGAESAEEASDNGKLAIENSLSGLGFDEYVGSSGSFEAGRSKTCWPRQRAAWCVVWLRSTEQWAFESVNLGIIPFGRIR